MSNVKKITICILAISLVVLAITTNVFATDDLFSALAGNNANNTISNIETKNNTNVDTNSNTNTNSNINTNTNVNSNINKNTNASNAEEHADAGVDYSIVFIIAVCGISTIYAYKKIRDYNV